MQSHCKLVSMLGSQYLGSIAFISATRNATACINKACMESGSVLEDSKSVRECNWLATAVKGIKQMCCSQVVEVYCRLYVSHKVLHGKTLMASERS